MRLEFSTSIVSLKPWPSAPIMFPAGTAQSSNTSSAVDVALMPILPCWGMIVKPSAPLSTTRASMPRVRCSLSWVARTTNISASSALVVNSLLPFST